jgi:hypothetical protein
MTDEQYVSWLMFVTRELMAHRPPRTAAPTDNAGPRYHDANTYTIEDEPFSRWMGWRGQDAQEQECAWPADELKAERQARHMRAFKQLRDENAELRRFLVSLRSGIDQFLKK